MTSERHQSAADQLRQLLHEHTYTPEQIAETSVHALYPKLSEGAANTFGRLGRGAVLMDLRDLEGGKLDTTYVPLDMLRRLSEESDVFDEGVRAASAYDPLGEFVVIVWQPTLIMVYKLEQV
jgi:hypothetical protein